jgi:hypothetical protein
MKGRRAVSIRVFSFALFSFFGAACVAVATLHRATPSKQLDISYEFKESEITLHEPLVLIFKVHNGLDQPVALDMGENNIQSFEFALISPRGQTIQGRHQRSMGLSTTTGNLPVEPGGDFKLELILNQWFELGALGKYLLTARLNTAIDTGGMSTAPHPAQSIPFEIKPRDVNRLRKVCAELVSRVENAGGVEAEREPALELSYVNDPIAAPYLAEVLARHMLNYDLAIQGFERIGNDDAVEALLSALDDEYGDIAVLARRALTRMQDRISNPNLRETVRRALEKEPPPSSQ